MEPSYLCVGRACNPDYINSVRKLIAIFKIRVWIRIWGLARLCEIKTYLR